jgi:hypothetical protein
MEELTLSTKGERTRRNFVKRGAILRSANWARAHQSRRCRYRDGLCQLRHDRCARRARVVGDMIIARYFFGSIGLARLALDPVAESFHRIDAAI